MSFVSPRLSFIGCGRAARALGFLFQDAGVFELGDVLTRSKASAEAAVTEMEAGRWVASFEDLVGADVFLLGTPDDTLGAVARSLLASGVLQSGNLVFHLSGALSAADVFADYPDTIRTASCHPLRSFSDFNESVHTFSGTWCGLEGADAGRQHLGLAMERIGARLFRIESGQKLAYHAGSVMASNYLNATIGSAIDCLGLAGIDPNTALQVLTPLFENTIRNIAGQGPGAALTGPIARGDVATVRREMETLSSADPTLARTYQIMGIKTVELAFEGGRLDAAARQALLAALDSERR